MFLLDTNIIIAYLKGNHAIKDKIISNIEEIAVSALVIAELNYGAKSSQYPEKNLISQEQCFFLPMRDRARV
ncbi:MAG: PIN domain-containing protein [Nitrospirae bacterium]|nr:PIN domain-containing protein [Nitrospirota bacterium]